MAFTEDQSKVLQTLAGQTQPRSTQWIRGRTGLPSVRVSNALLTLRREGRVRRVGGHWQAVGAVAPPPAVSFPPSRPSGGAGTGGDQAGLQTDSGGEIAWGQAGRWQDFRNLCRYYAECVRLDEHPHVSAWQHQVGESWGELPGSIDWRALSGQRGVSTAGSDALVAMVKQNRHAREMGAFAVGLAVDLFDSGRTRPGGEPIRGVVPILFVRVWARVDQGRLELHPVSGPELNQQWLEKKFRDRDRRQGLLDALDILPSPRTPDADEDEAVLEPLLVPSLDECLARLFDQTQGMWREPGDIAMLRSDPPLQSIQQSGIYNRAILAKLPELKYAKRLQRELIHIAEKATDEELEQTALRVLFPSGARREPEARAGEQIAEPVLLNGDQREAVEAAVAADLAVITGPPGTGKSTVVQTALINQALRRRPSLFASRNHQGLEAVEPKLNALVEPDRLMMRPVYPWGSPERRFAWQRVMVELLSKPARPGIIEQRESATERLDGLLRAQRDDERAIECILDLRDKLSDANERVRLARERLPGPIASVTLEEIERLPTQLCSRIAVVLRRLERWPGGVAWLPRLLFGWWARRRLRRARPAAGGGGLSGVFDSILGVPTARLAERLEVFERLGEVGRAERLVKELEDQRRALGQEEILRDRLHERHAQLVSQTKHLLELVAGSAGSGISPELRERLAAIRAGLANHGEALEEDDPLQRQIASALREAMPELLQHYPLWAVSNLSVSKAVPLSPAIMDLVVVDEASQCDLASVVPLLYRARRAMIVGDPMQLPHVTQLSRDSDLHARRRLGVESFEFESWSFRANSLFDLASSRPGAVRVELRSHYRCHPAIADYCNTGFYNKTLWVRTSEETVRARFSSANGRHGCLWTDVTGPIQRASSGCCSPAQIDAVVAELRRLEEAGFGGSVGVVTPFRVQANRIRDRVHAEFAQRTLTDWGFLVDTADGFQGDERDLMLFSLVGGSDMPQGSRGFLADNPNRFNVAVSRARAILHVIGDAGWAGSSGIAYIEELLRRCRAPVADRVVRTDLIGPVWEPRFANALRESGLPVQQQYPACGYFLDVALLRQGLKLDVEIDGEQYHRDRVTGERRIDDVYRDTVLKGLGWDVLRFWVYELREDFDGCVQRVRDAYERSA